MCSEILPVYKKACLVDILLVVIKIVSYLILNWPSHLGVYCRRVLECLKEILLYQ